METTLVAGWVICFALAKRGFDLAITNFVDFLEYISIPRNVRHSPIIKDNK
jgi:hypothetical protein